MAIKVNLDKRKERIKEECNRIIDKIGGNANNGESVTEFYVSKEIARDVKSNLIQQLEDSDTKFTFLVIRRDTNPYTGKIDLFSSEVVGDEMRYKIKIK